MKFLKVSTSNTASPKNAYDASDNLSGAESGLADSVLSSDLIFSAFSRFYKADA